MQARLGALGLATADDDEADAPGASDGASDYDSLMSRFDSLKK